MLAALRAAASQSPPEASTSSTIDEEMHRQHRRRNVSRAAEGERIPQFYFPLPAAAASSPESDSLSPEATEAAGPSCALHPPCFSSHTPFGVVEGVYL